MAKERKPQSLISYPVVFKPLLDKEFNEGGYASYKELMGDILAEHYGVTWFHARKIDPPVEIRPGVRDGSEEPVANRIVEPWEREEART